MSWRSHNTVGFEVSRAGGRGQRIGRVLSRRGAGSANLRFAFDKDSQYWQDMWQELAFHHGDGIGETIAVIDSGCNPELYKRANVDPTKCVDLTNDQSGTLSPHGTTIATLLSLVAPAAVQYHVRIFDHRDRIAAPTREAAVDVVREALNYVARVGATIVNISWNIKRQDTEDNRQLMPGFTCNCPLCTAITDFVRQTDIDVFVSEGNFALSAGEKRPYAKLRKQGERTCPPAAGLIIPVVAVTNSGRAYDTNLATAAAIPAPLKVDVECVQKRWFGLERHFTESLVGSSFSTPIAAATLAAFRSAFHRCSCYSFDLPPRNASDSEVEDVRSTDFTFPLDHLFEHPQHDRSSLFVSSSENWVTFYLMCLYAAEPLAKSNDLVRAGLLCCMFADLWSVAYKAQGDKRDNPSGAGLVTMYIKGVRYLQQSGTPYTVSRTLRNAYSVLGLLDGKHESFGVLQKDLAELSAINDEYKRREGKMFFGDGREDEDE